MTLLARPVDLADGNLLRHGGLRRLSRAARIPAMLVAALICVCGAAADCHAQGQSVVDPLVAQRVLKSKDGLLENIETLYNNIDIAKRGPRVAMAFRRHGNDYIESVSNLADWTELPVTYTQVMTVALAYPETPSRMLMIGLGAGSLSQYLAGYLPELQIDNVELDPGVIAAARKYFGLTERNGVKLIAGDGRVFLMRQQKTYDMFFIDAFRGGYVPFHLLTKEFYQILARRLAPKGVAVFNVHQGTKLFDSTLKTLSTVFPSIDTYGTGTGSVIVAVSTEAKREAGDLMARASALQQRYTFRYPLTKLVAARHASPAIPAANTLTDDFAPVDLYEGITKHNERRW
jgi:spermidine synthase